MYRILATGLLLTLAGAASAQQCYYYWTADCFEIRDAARRDIVHHVLLSRSPREFQATSGQCELTIEERLGIDERGAALKRFNRILGRIEGCARLADLKPLVFTDGPEAFESYEKLLTERSFKVVHDVGRLPGP